jgi:hypothetical protein
MTEQSPNLAEAMNIPAVINALTAPTTKSNPARGSQRVLEAADAAASNSARMPIADVANPCRTSVPRVTPRAREYDPAGDTCCHHRDVADEMRPSDSGGGELQAGGGAGGGGFICECNDASQRTVLSGSGLPGGQLRNELSGVRLGASTESTLDRRSRGDGRVASVPQWHLAEWSPGTFTDARLGS